MKNPFLYDDKPLIVENAFIKSFNNAGRVFLTDLHYFGSSKLAQGRKVSYYRPVIALSFMADFFLWGLNSFGYHLTNVLFHICNAVLIFILAQTLVPDKRIGIIASLLFLVHPINTEAVTYISGRGDPVSLFFILISLLFFVHHAKKHGKTFSIPNLLSGVFFALALLTRENNISFIFILSAYLYVWQKPGKISRYFYNLLPHIIILALFLIFRIGVLGISAPLGLIQDPIRIRLMTLPKVIFEYLSLLLFPRDLHMGRTLAPVRTIASPYFIFPFAVVLLIFVFISRSLKKDKFLQFSVLWAVVTFLPFSSVITPLTTYIAEHWIYIPFAGVSLAAGIYAAGLFDKFKKYKLLIAIALLAIFSYYAAITIDQNRNWKSAEAFYKRTSELEKGDYRLKVNLAVNKLQEGQNNEAIKLLNSVLNSMPKEKAATELGMYHFGIVYKTLGDAYRAKGDLEGAIGYYLKAIDINPKFSDAYNELGSCYFKKGDEKGAVEAYEKSITFSPDTWQPYANLGQYYLEKGDLSKARRYWGKVLELKPGFADAINALNEIGKREQQAARP